MSALRSMFRLRGWPRPRGLDPLLRAVPRAGAGRGLLRDRRPPRRHALRLDQELPRAARHLRHRRLLPRERRRVPPRPRRGRAHRAGDPGSHLPAARGYLQRGQQKIPNIITLF